jgi:hypothetical protein
MELSTLTINELQELFNMVTQIKSKVAEIDPDTERSLVTNRGLDNIFLQLFSELKKKQIKKSITDFFNSKATIYILNHQILMTKFLCTCTIAVIQK